MRPCGSKCEKRHKRLSEGATPDQRPRIAERGGSRRERARSRCIAHRRNQEKRLRAKLSASLNSPDPAIRRRRAEKVPYGQTATGSVSLAANSRRGSTKSLLVQRCRVSEQVDRYMAWADLDCAGGYTPAGQAPSWMPIEHSNMKCGTFRSPCSLPGAWGSNTTSVTAIVASLNLESCTRSTPTAARRGRCAARMPRPCCHK